MAAKKAAKKSAKKAVRKSKAKPELYFILVSECGSNDQYTYIDEATTLDAARKSADEALTNCGYRDESTVCIVQVLQTGRVKNSVAWD